MTTKNEDLELNLWALKSITTTKVKQSDEWLTISRNILDDDLGLFTDSYNSNYELDGQTRDRLIVHARQDAAMACIIASDTHQLVRLSIRIGFFTLIAAFVGVTAAVSGFL